MIKKVPEFFRERLRMKKKMETEKGKLTYGLRKTIVEPVIGNIKYNLGFDEFRIRGLDGAKLELNLASIAHNLKKIWVARGKIAHKNKILFFELIINSNYLNYDPACKVWSFIKIMFPCFEEETNSYAKDLLHSKECRFSSQLMKDSH